jgi:hypothetical protein
MFTQGGWLEDGRSAPGGSSSIAAAGGGLWAAMCRYFSRLWEDTQRLAPNTIRLYRQQATFPRFEAYMKREPPRSRHAKCRCGSGDAWRCWSRVRALELYGCGRRDDGAMLLRDSEAIDPEDGGQ